MNDFFGMSNIFIFQLPRKIIFGNGTMKRIGEETIAPFAGEKALMITNYR